MHGRSAIIFFHGGKIWMYNHGTISLVGDWLAFKSTGTSVVLTKNADNLSLAINDAVGWAYGQNQIDLTDINTLYFYGASSHGSALLYYGIVASNSGLNTNYTQVQIPLNGASSLVSLDVSAVTGNYFIRFGRFGTTKTTTTVTCYEVYGE